MCGPLLLLGLGLVVAEFALLVELGQHVGTLATLGLVGLTAAVGLMAARDQGLAALQRMRARQLEGTPNDAEMLDGPLVLVAALLLLMPGFITDTAGALLLIPPLRRVVARALARRMGPPGGGSGRQRGRIVILRGPPPDDPP